MSVDCVAVFAQKDTETKSKFNAESPEQAKEKTKIILFDTDLINFTDDGFVCGEADITEQREDGLDGVGENTPQENEDCSDCPYFCPVCGECMYEDDCEE